MKMEKNIYWLSSLGVGLDDLQKSFPSPYNLSFNDLSCYSHILILLPWKIISIQNYVKT